MKKSLLIGFALSLLCTAAAAQNQDVCEPNYELAARFTAKKVSQMVFSTTASPKWMVNSDKFWYEWKTSDGTQYYIVDAATGVKKPVFDMEKLAMQLTEIIKDPFDAQHIPFQKLKLKDDDTFSFEIKSTLPKEKKEGEKEVKGAKKVFRFEYDINSAELKDVTAEEEKTAIPSWAKISPDSSKVVFTKNHNLYWMSFEDMHKLMKDKKDSTVVEHQLTSDATDDIAYAGGAGKKVSDKKARSSASGCWSPDSRYFVTSRIDMSNIKELWTINSVSEPRPTLNTYKYQMPGEPGPKRGIFIFDLTDGSKREVPVTAYKDQTNDIISKPSTNKDTYKEWKPTVWAGDNSKFYIERDSRDLKRIDVCAVNVSDLSVTPVIEERLNTYIETQPVKFINDGKEIIWWSERTGWAQLYLYSADGKLKNPITNGAFHVDKVLSVDEKNRVVYFLAMGVNKEENPYHAHIFRIGLDGKGMKQLDDANYSSASVSFSEDGKYFVNSFSRVDSTPQVALYDNNGKKTALETADFSLLLAAGYKFPTPFKVKAADGITDLYGYMYKPFDFDSTKRYPILDYVYPGPQVEGNDGNWSKGFLRKDRLAQIGFIVITVGNRGGHPDRSKWYHNYGYGNLRDYGLEDQKYAIQQLASRYSFIDINRVGIHGHSGGGFMSTAAILKYPDFFKVAVSCAGNHDNSIYNRWWSETHHGVQETISEKGDTTFKYSIKTNQELAKNLKGHLMLVHGDYDDNVSPSNTIRVVDALIRANKRFDLLILPGQKHGFGDMNEYFFWRMADYYSEWLLGSSHRSQVDITELNND
ncbi:MAG: S9 family peptidase [Bacteroidales bacterium]|nr:S9 family peptidase [Bacteroidales bacterium]